MLTRVVFCVACLLLPTALLAATVQLPETGQSMVYASRDDGALQQGAAWPSPRFVDNGNGTLTDNLTGLIWLQTANCMQAVGGIDKSGGDLTWANALAWSNSLSSGFCGLSDDSMAGDWRLPNIRELESLANAGQADSAAWLNGQGFTAVQDIFYWSSTTHASLPDKAWYVNMIAGYLNKTGKLAKNYVWPVRGGHPAVLSVTKAGSGSGTVIPSSGGLVWDGAIGTASYPENTAVTLTATADTGSTFTGWSDGGCSGTGECQVMLDESKSVVAAFGANPVLSATITGSGNINSITNGVSFSCTSGTCTTSFSFGTELVLRATAGSGQLFSGWSEDCGGTGDCPLTMNSNKSVMAAFTESPLVRVVGGGDYAALSSAYEAVVADGTIEARDLEFVESLILNRGIAFTLKGGYASDYRTNDGWTILSGSLTIASDCLTVEQLAIH